MFSLAPRITDRLAACSTTCPVGEGASATHSSGLECSMNSDRVCGTCNAGRFSQNTDLDCEGTSRCVSVLAALVNCVLECSKTCPLGEGGYTATSSGADCTNSSDRICGLCDAGRFSDNLNLECQSESSSTGSLALTYAACSTACPANTGVGESIGGRNCTSDADRVCAPCREGFRNDGTQLDCAGD